MYRKYHIVYKSSYALTLKKQKEKKKNMESFEENNMLITQSGTYFSIFDTIFVTQLAKLIGTAFSCVGFPLMSATVLPRTFNH